MIQKTHGGYFPNIWCITFSSHYNNGFVWKSQQSAYFALAGCLPNKDKYTQDFYCLTSGSKYKNLVYFITYVKFVYEYAVHLLFCANSKYANEFQLNMPHDYIGTYLL